MKRLFVLAAVSLVSSPALAGDLCYEVVGCVQDRNISALDAEKLGCDQLWTVRNGIFASRGYCFSTKRGIEEFGNENCRYGDQNEVPLNDYERANIRIIQSIEKRRGC
ncbi:YARHG domain-containing protein [Hyphomicrobium sp. NDB2Meth4]|uniref:YARHG domain-containing protein n=1 Tax=Hyphomicrobium sp. NDB2Meth4 TaxID=1892846 RepID=UPI000931141E|nr:YARHG domain-containing protein [Hyphomicrobium sp. NDB2Meth4]